MQIRCFMPPRQLVRELPQPVQRIGNADEAQQFGGAVARGGSAERLVPAQDFDQLFADAEDRVHRIGRVLEDHRHALAAQPAHRGLVEPQQIALLEAQRAADDPRRRRHQAQHREACHGLAAAGLADQPQRLACTHGEVDAVDHRGDPRSGEEMHPKIADRKQIGHCFSRGLKASDSPSANRLKPSTVMKIAAPGASTAQGDTFST
jgi:hypothetical protein